MRQAEARVIQTPRRKINHKYRSQGYGQRVGIEPQGSRIQRRARARVNRLRHVEESMRGGRQATQVAQSRHTPQHAEILYGMRPRKMGGRCRIRSTP